MAWLASGALGVTPASAGRAPTPARVQVVANEYSLALSRLRVVGGPVIVQLVNFGEDAHDLRLRRDGGTRTYRIAATAPGEERELEARLRAGRFTLWCSLGNHRALGMEARLRVVNSAPPRKRAGQPAGG